MGPPLGETPLSTYHGKGPRQRGRPHRRDDLLEADSRPGDDAGFVARAWCIEVHTTIYGCYSRCAPPLCRCINLHKLVCASVPCRGEFVARHTSRPNSSGGKLSRFGLRQGVWRSLRVVVRSCPPSNSHDRASAARCDDNCPPRRTLWPPRRGRVLGGIGSVIVIIVLRYTSDQLTGVLIGLSLVITAATVFRAAGAIARITQASDGSPVTSTRA